MRRALLVLVVLAAAFPAAAQAEPPACPDEPAVYAGTDDVVGELRALRVDQRGSCLAVAGRVDRLHDDLVQLHADLGQLDGHAVDVRQAVDAVSAAVAALGVDEAHALHVLPPASVDPPAGTVDHPTVVELSPASSAQVDDGFAAVHGDGWLLMGLLGALYIGQAMVREFTFRTAARS